MDFSVGSIIDQQIEGAVQMLKRAEANNNKELAGKQAKIIEGLMLLKQVAEGVSNDNG